MRSKREVEEMVAKLENFIKQKEYDLQYGADYLGVLGDHGREMAKILIHNCKQEICLLKWVLAPEGSE